MWHHLQTPASPDDVFELPASPPRKASQKKKHTRKKRHIAKKITASICLGLSLMAPVASYAATDLYISGGGGGGGSVGVVTASGGTHAGAGEKDFGGGAYIGDGTDPATGRTPKTSGVDPAIANAEAGLTNSPYSGGSATLTETNLTGFTTIHVLGGDGGKATSSGITVGYGGNATLIVTDTMTGNLILKDGTKEQDDMMYPSRADGGKARATIYIWDARDQYTTFNKDQTSQADIKHLITYRKFRTI
ncbi:MAG: hypothetical protein IJA79_09595 [Desulfovibrio sp.]|nr:hypothetical protein [Desulfovibrio sp.]